MFETDDAAMAFRSGSDWVLRPVCPIEDDSENAVAVDTASGWVVSAADPPEDDDENGFVIDTASGAILLAPECPDDEDDPEEFVADPLCEQCNTNVYALQEEYLVSVSGFPSVCTGQLFNGVWTLSWSFDCSWAYNITDWHKITLLRDSSGLWRLSWRIASSTGISGIFIGDTPDSCDPTAQSYVYDSCVNSFLCTGICTAVVSDVVIAVTNV